MKGCAGTCLLWLGGWVAAAGAFYLYFRELAIFSPQIYWAAGAAGLCIVLIASYVYGIFKFRKERAMLLGAMIGQPLQDGTWVAVSGVIRSLNPLRTPLTGLPAVAYTYEIYRMVRSGKSTSKATYYEGKALASSTIATKQGTIRLLAVPTLDVKSENTTTSQGIAHAKEYIATTTFQTSKTPKDQRTGMEEESADDDGVFRVDKKMSDDEPEIEQCQLEEKHIKQGETICAFGLYSSQRGGLIPHPNWANQGRLMRGDAHTVAAQLRSSMIKYTIGIVVCASIAFGIVKLYQYHARSQAETVSLGSPRSARSG
jgi:hypothetical protein